MFRSLFARLAATYLTITLASLMVLAFALAGLLQSFFFHDKEQTLIRYGHELGRLIGHLPRSRYERERLAIRLETLDRVIDARIWIVAPDGTILADSMRGGAGGVMTVDPDDMSMVMSGATIVRRGYFRGHFRFPVISVGLPLYAGGQPGGAIFLHSPVYGVRIGILQVYRLFGMAAFLSITIALVLSLWLSRRIARPLQEMSEAAQALAQGRFEERVAVPPAGSAGEEVARLAVSFNHMAEQLGKLERMRRQFIADVSHELRSPLTSMRGFLQGVLDGTIPPQQQERYLSLAFDETKRLSRLVQDLLDLASIEAGDVRFNLQKMDPVPVVARVLDKMEPQAEEKRLEVQPDMPPEGMLAIMADPDRLEQVMINLLDNAIRFTPEGGQITVRVGEQGNKVGAGEPLVEISVTDTGPGISPEEIDLIWERFYKSDPARTRSRGGTGLGLAIVRELVRRQGGNAYVESRVGEGTTFRVVFPSAL